MDPLARARVARSPLIFLRESHRGCAGSVFLWFLAGGRVARSPLVWAAPRKAPCAPGAPGARVAAAPAHGGRRMPIAAAPHGPRRRRDRAGSAGGNRGCLRSTLGSCRLRLGPAPRWDMHLPQAGLCEMALGGSCDGAPGRSVWVLGRSERSRCGGAPWSRPSSASAPRAADEALLLCVDGVKLSRLDHASRAADASRYLCDVNSGLH